MNDISMKSTPLRPRMDLVPGVDVWILALLGIFGVMSLAMMRILSEQEIQSFRLPHLFYLQAAWFGGGGDLPG